MLRGYEKQQFCLYSYHPAIMAWLNLPQPAYRSDNDLMVSIAAAALPAVARATRWFSRPRF